MSDGFGFLILKFLREPCFLMLELLTIVSTLLKVKSLGSIIPLNFYAFIIWPISAVSERTEFLLVPEMTGPFYLVMMLSFFESFQPPLRGLVMAISKLYLMSFAFWANWVKPSPLILGLCLKFEAMVLLRGEFLAKSYSMTAESLTYLGLKLSRFDSVCWWSRFLEFANRIYYPTIFLTSEGSASLISVFGS